jgi:hypothetical protein
MSVIIESKPCSTALTDVASEVAAKAYVEARDDEARAIRQSFRVDFGGLSTWRAAVRALLNGGIEVLTK